MWYSINSVGVGFIMECRKCFGNARCLWTVTWLSSHHSKFRLVQSIIILSRHTYVSLSFLMFLMSVFKGKVERLIYVFFWLYSDKPKSQNIYWGIFNLIFCSPIPVIQLCLYYCCVVREFDCVSWLSLF